MPKPTSPKRGRGKSRSAPKGREGALARRRSALLRLSGNLAAALDEGEICRCVVERLQDESLGYKFVGLFLVDEATDERVMRAAVGWSDIPVGWRIPRGQGLSARAIADGQLHYTPDVTQEPLYIPGLSSGSELEFPEEDRRRLNGGVSRVLGKGTVGADELVAVVRGHLASRAPA